MDYYFNELYWVDARARNIRSYNLKTKVQREIVSHLDAHGFDIDVFEDWIYLTDWHKESIIQIHKVRWFCSLRRIQVKDILTYYYKPAAFNQSLKATKMKFDYKLRYLYLLPTYYKPAAFILWLKGGDYKNEI